MSYSDCVSKRCGLSTWLIYGSSHQSLTPTSRSVGYMKQDACMPVSQLVYPLTASSGLLR